MPTTATTHSLVILKDAVEGLEATIAHTDSAARRRTERRRTVIENTCKIQNTGLSKGKNGTVRKNCVL